LLSLCGCGGKKIPPWGSLSGAVTLDGKPAKVVTVIFENRAKGVGMTATTDDGGAIYNAEALTLSGDAISGNKSAMNSGGGVYTTGNVTSSNDTFSGNSADFGGGIAISNATISSTNDTFFGNSALDFGGGIWNAGTLATTNDTIVGNFSSPGGGIYNSNKTWTSLNTIVAGNLAASGSTTPSDVYNYSGITHASYTLIGDPNSAGGITVGGTTHNIVGASASTIFQTSLSGTPLLGNNGGSTETVALAFNSPAINVGGAVTSLTAAVTSLTATSLTVASSTSIAVGDALQIDSEVFVVTAVNSATSITVVRGQSGTAVATHAAGAAIMLATDQTGLVRLGNDLGARNSQHSLIVNTTADDTASPTTTHLTLRNAIAIADADVFPANNTTGETIAFQNGLTGTISLTQGAIGITNSMSIPGPGANLLTISGNNSSQIFIINNSNRTVINQVAITGLTLMNGNAANSTNSVNAAGGAIYNSETLTLFNDTFAGNAAIVQGGAVFNSGSLTSTNNTYSNNSAINYGGGFDNNGGKLTSTNDTFTSNSSPNGSGIENSMGTLTTTNDSITGNFGGNGAVGNSGGTWNSLSTIVAGNLTTAGSTVSSDVVNMGTIKASYTLIGDPNSAGGITAGGSNHNIVGAATNVIFQTTANGSPLLANNGGPTQTIALAAGSPAINTGGTLTTVATAVTSLTTTILTVSNSSFIVVGDVLRIDNEVMVVTTVNTPTSITVTRGQLGTNATNHAVNAAITLAEDQRGIVRSLNDIGSFGVAEPTLPYGATVATSASSVVVASGIDFALSTGGGLFYWAGASSGWTQIAGNTSSFQVGSNGTAYALLPYGGLYGWTLSGGWSFVAGNVSSYQAGPNGTAYVLQPGGKLSISQNGTLTLLKSNVSSFQVGPDGTVYAQLPYGALESWPGSGSAWTSVAANVSSYQIAANDTVYILQPGGNLSTWQNGSLTLLKANVSSFQVAPNGTVYAMLPYGSLQCWTPGSSWTVVEGNVTSFQVSPNGIVYLLQPGGNLDDWQNGSLSTMQTNVNSFQLAPNGMIYAMLPYGVLKSSTGPGSSWTQLEGNVSSYQVAPNGMLYALQPGGNLDLWEYGSWALTAAKTNSFEFGPDGTLYDMLPYGGLYTWSGFGGTWSPVAGGVSSFQVAANGTLFVQQGTNLDLWENDSLTLLSANTSSFEVGPDGTLYLVLSGNALYSWSGFGGVWTSLESNITSYEIAANGTLFALQSGNLAIWESGAWATLTGNASSFQIGSNGTVYVVLSGNALNSWTGFGGTWTSLQNGISSYQVAPNGMLYALLSNNLQVWENGSWATLTGNASSFQIGPDGTLYVLLPGSALYSWTGFGGTWASVAGNVTSYQVLPNGNIIINGQLFS